MSPNQFIASAVAEKVGVIETARALADRGNLGRETVRLLIKDELGVIRIRLGRHTIYSIPESVAVRVHTRR